METVLLPLLKPQLLLVLPKSAQMHQIQQQQMLHVKLSHINVSQMELDVWHQQHVRQQHLQSHAKEILPVLQLRFV